MLFIKPFTRQANQPPSIVQRLVTWFKKTTTLVELLAALFIILFIYTGLNKLMGYEKFAFEMGRSPFIQSFSKLIASTLPTAELLLALLLISKRFRLFALYLSYMLMALFTGYIALMLNYAYDLPCSCGGILAAMSWKDHLVFNAVFTLLAVLGIVLETRRRSEAGSKR